MGVDIKQTTILVTVSTQHGFKKSANKMITTRYIHTASKVLISKLIMTVSRFRVRVVTLDIIIAISYEIYFSSSSLQLPLFAINELNRHLEPC